MDNYQRPEWIDRAPAVYRQILEDHDKWLKGIDGGKRADLSLIRTEGTDLWELNIKDSNQKHSLLKNSFTSGQLSPLMNRRSDQDSYRLRAETMQNFTILPQGGITRRLGSLHIKETNLTNTKGLKDHD